MRLELKILKELLKTSKDLHTCLQVDKQTYLLANALIDHQSIKETRESEEVESSYIFLLKIINFPTFAAISPSIKAK